MVRQLTEASSPAQKTFKVFLGGLFIFQAFHYFGFIVFGVLALGGPSADGSLVSRSRSLQRNLEAFLVFFEDHTFPIEINTTPKILIKPPQI